MLNTVVAIVLGNAAVATLFALGVVLLARWYHKPALLHGLWVVVLLKLVTPPMLTIPVPVEISGIMPVEDDVGIANFEDSRPVESTAAPMVPAEQPLAFEPGPTILIESPLEPEDAEADRDPLANLPIEIASALEPAVVPTEETRETTSISSETIAFPATVPSGGFVQTNKATPAAYSWRMLLWLGLLVWGAGALYVFLSAWRQILRFERSLQDAVPAGDALRNRVEELSRRLGLSRPPAVYLLRGAISPMLWGFGRKPRLLLPRDLLAGLNEDAVETLILHELAHMRRGDHWVRVLELFCQCIYWWHPVVWWGRQQLRIVEEECCDAFVVEHCPGGVYARALLATVDFLSQKKTALPPAASGIGNLEFLKRRLTMIIEGGVSARLAGLPKFFLLTAAVVGLSVLPRLVAQTAEAAKDNAAEAEAEAPAEEKPADAEANPNAPPQPPAAPKAAANLIGQEPLEFEKQPRGYPTAQIEVRDLAFSPDGKLLAAGYGKWDTLGEVVVYDYSTKRVLKKFPFAKGIASVKFSIDGKYLAASIWNNLLQIWDTETWNLVADKSTGSNVARLAFSPDGTFLAWGNEAGELKLVSVGKWEEERALTGDLFRFQKVAFSPDSKLLCAVGGSFNQPRFGRGLIFEVETGKEIAKIETDGAVIASAAFSPDGKELATGEYATALRFWEPKSGKPISVIQIGGTMDTLEYTPDGTLVGPSYSGQVHIIKNRQILRTMSGHEGRSLSVRMSPDGKTLVSGGIDALIRVWNPETGVPMGTIRPNEVLEDTQEAVLAIAHSPDGRYVVTTHEDTSIRLRNAESGEFIKMMKGHEDVVSTVAFSPDSKTLATGSYDHLIKLWNVETGETLRDLKGHSNWVFSVAFSPDGKTLASGGYDKTIRLWNVETGETAAVLEGHAAAVRSLAFSPGGEQLVSGSSDRTLRLWDLKTQKTLQEMKGHTAAVRAVAFSPHGGKIASASEDQTIKFWNPATGESTQELKGHTGMVWALAFSPRGRTLASGGFDNSLRIWNGETGAALQTLTGHQDVITALSYAPNSSSLVTGSYDKTLKIWPAVEPPIPALADLHIGDASDTPGVRFVAYSPDGTRMITGNQNRGIRLWDLKTGRVIKTVYQPRGISDGTYSPDGKLLATAGYGEQSYLWNAETLKLLATLETGHTESTVVAFAPDGKLLAVGAADGAMSIWNVETREKLRDLPQQELPVGGLAFSPDGTLLASGTGNYKEHQKPGTVKLWNTKTWEEVANLTGPTAKIRRVAFSPDGTSLVAGGSQPELLVYDVPNKKLANKVPFGTEVACAAFLPDSRTLVLGGYDGSVGLWSLETRGRIARFEGHQPANQQQRYIFSVAVSADASVVASAGADGHVKLWPTSTLPPAKPLASMKIDNGEPFSVAVSPDGSRLAIATTLKTIEIRETKTGSVLRTIGGFNTSCVSVSFAPDGKWIAGAAQSGWATVWNAETGEKLFSAEAHPDGARRAVFSPDGQMLATCGWDETAAVWNLPDGSLRYRTPKQGLSLSDVTFSPEGKLLVTATGSYHEWRKPGSLKIWNAADGAFVADYGSHEAEIKGILIDAGGRFLVTYGSKGAKVWDRITRKVLHSLGAGPTITAAVLSPDGDMLFAGDRTGRMMIYDVKTGNIKQTLEGHEDLVYSMASSPDGTLLASSSRDGSVKLWPGNRIPAPSPLAQVLDDPEQSRAVAYSPDGKWIAVGGKDSTISLREASTLKEVHELKGHRSMIFQLAFPPDGQSLLSSSSDGTVRLWSLADGKEVVKWTAHGEKLATARSLAVSPDGKRIAAGNDLGESFVWDRETRKEIFRLPAQALPVTGFAFSPDGKLLASGTGDWKQWKTPGELKLWNSQTGEAVATLPGHDGEIKGMLFNRDGRMLISYGADQSVRIWDVATRSLIRRQVMPHNISAAALANEETLLIGDTFGTLSVADFPKGGVRASTRGHFDFLSGIAASPDGRQFATVSHDGYLKTWPAQLPELAARQIPANDQTSVRLAEKIRHWEPLVLEPRTAQTAVRVKQLKPHGDKIWFAQYSPDGTVLATGGADKTVKLWNPQTMEPLLTLAGHEDYTTYAAFSPDGKSLATVAWDRAVKLWDVATGRLLASAQPHEAGCRRVAFSPDGQKIATASEDGFVRLFDKDLTLIHSLNLGLNVYSLAFSPDGKLLAAGTGNWREKKNGRITLWDPETGQKIKELENSDGIVYQLQFLKDSRRVLAAKPNEGLAIWNVETNAVEETYPTRGNTRWVEISRDEKRLVTSHSLGMVTVWNRYQSEPVADFKASEGFIHCATFSPDGKQLVVGDEASTLSIWEIRDAPADKPEDNTAAKR